MFKLELKPKGAGHGTGQIGTITWEETGYSVCRVESWAFASCGIGALMGFNNTNFQTKEHVAKFFEFVAANVADDWQPDEFYFLLTDSQLKLPANRLMINHPHVKKRDVFMNKSHGPNKLHLFRYSHDNDFKPIRVRKPKETV